MEQGVPECCRNKFHQRPPPPPPPPDTCVGGRAPPSRPYSPAPPSRPYSPPYAQPYAQPYAPRSHAAPAPTRAPAPCAQPPRTPVPPRTPAYRNYPSPVPSSPTGPRVETPHMQLVPMQFSNMLDEPTESCVIIEEEIERVEPVDFHENMQNVKKEVKLVRPYGVVIQSIEEERAARGVGRLHQRGLRDSRERPPRQLSVPAAERIRYGDRECLYRDLHGLFGCPWGTTPDSDTRRSCQPGHQSLRRPHDET